MSYIICGLIFMAVVVFLVWWGWQMHKGYTFGKLDEIVTEGIASMNEHIKAGEIDKCLSFYEGYCYALRLAGIRLGANLDGIDIGKD